MTSAVLISRITAAKLQEQMHREVTSKSHYIHYEHLLYEWKILNKVFYTNINNNYEVYRNKGMQSQEKDDKKLRK